MDTLKKSSQLFVPCLGCGNKVWMILKPPVYVISTPEIVCSEECANRHEVHMKRFMEMQNKDEFVD